MKIITTRAVVLMLVLLVVCGCAAMSLENRVGVDRAALAEFTREDLQAAFALATKKQDLAAMTCYPALLTRLAERQAEPREAPKGAVTAYETLRLAVRGDDAGAEPVKVACAALAVQTGVDIAKIAAIAAGGIGNAPEALKGGKALLKLFKGLGL